MRFLVQITDQEQAWTEFDTLSKARFDDFFNAIGETVSELTVSVV